MSRNGHHSLSSEVNYLLTEILNLTPEQQHIQYGIEIRGNGTVFDTTYDLTFSSVHQWATFIVQHETDQDGEDLYDKHRDDEEY